MTTRGTLHLTYRTPEGDARALIVGGMSEMDGRALQELLSSHPRMVAALWAPSRTMGSLATPETVGALTDALAGSKMPADHPSYMTARRLPDGKWAAVLMRWDDAIGGYEVFHTDLGRFADSDEADFLAGNIATHERLAYVPLEATA